jgi:hypothetical protein
VFPRGVTVYLEVPAADTRPRRTVSRQRERGWSDDRQRYRRGDRCDNEVRTVLVDCEQRPRAGDGPPEILTLGAGSGLKGDWTILPVFSFEEEALLFLRLCGFGGGWHASKRGIADLASVLSDACSDVRRVALDPIPEFGSHGPYDFVSLSREEFVGLLSAGR